MPQTSEEAVLMALDTREQLFDALQEVLSSNKRLKVLMTLGEDMDQRSVATEVGVGQSTVSRAIDEFKEYGLIESTENGYKKSLPVLDHPLIQHYYRTEVEKIDE